MIDFDFEKIKSDDIRVDELVPSVVPESQSHFELSSSSTQNRQTKRAYHCSTCSKSYTSKSRLDIHFRTHFGEKPYECETCRKKFNEKGNLKIHNRIHNGEKPYACNFQGCPKKFKAYGHLSDHLRRHMNIRPFSCDVCNASFGRRNTLKTHILTHTGEKPHQCPTCGKKFSEKGNMRTHLKTHLKYFIKDDEFEKTPLTASDSSLTLSTEIYENRIQRTVELFIAPEKLKVEKKCHDLYPSGIGLGNANFMSEANRLFSNNGFSFGSKL